VQVIHYFIIYERNLFFPLSLPDFYQTWLCIWVTRRVSYKNQYSRAPEFTQVFVGSVLLIFLGFFCAVLLCVFTFWVPCCDIRYDFCIKRCWSLLPVVGRRARVLFVLLIFVWYSGVQHIMCCVFYFFLRLVPNVASFSGLSLRLVPNVASFSGLSLRLVPNVASFSGLSLRLVYPMLAVSLDCPFVLCQMLPVSLDCPFVLCQMLPVSLDCPFGIL
jgi:hypothetical protein